MTILHPPVGTSSACPLSPVRMHPSAARAISPPYPVRTRPRSPNLPCQGEVWGAAFNAAEGAAPCNQSGMPRHTLRLRFGHLCPLWVLAAGLRNRFSRLSLRGPLAARGNPYPLRPGEMENNEFAPLDSREKPSINHEKCTHCLHNINDGYMVSLYLSLIFFV